VRGTRFIQLLARGGYAARGIVYLIVGGLATLAAVGAGGQTTGSRGALATLLGEPLGKTLLVIIAFGLTGYALWRLIQSAQDTDGHGTDGKGLAIRGGLLVSAVTHALLAVYALQLVWAFGSSQSEEGSRSMSEWLLQQPFGVWLVGGVGVVVIGAGVAHAVKGWNTQFDRYLQMPRRTQAWAYPICRVGLIVRGVVLVIVGSYFLLAAYYVDPSQAGGLGDVFQTVRRQTFGAVLLGAVAIGLFAFGIYSLLEAVYRRVNVPTLQWPSAPQV
jgi:hypothetical protein